MRTIIIIYSLIFSFFLIAGCKEQDFKKTAGGMPYKLYKSGSGKKIANNYFLKINGTRSIKDSTIFTTEGKMPTYFMVNPNPAPYDISELWTSLEEGDSIVTIQMVDTFMQRNPKSIPPEFKKGDRIITNIKILKVFDTDSARGVDESKEVKMLQEQEVAFVSKYLDEKNIKAQKTPGGAFVEILNPGQGNLIDSGMNISAKYKGVSFSGITFDTNIDSSFGHTDPLTFIVGSGAMIKGFDEAMKFLRKGAVAKIYIPSMLAFGPNPGSDKIKPFEHVMFDITITDVKSSGAGLPVKK